MTTHTPHEATLDVGLVDDCPRCREHAADPLRSLDQAHVQDLWLRMITVEYHDGGRYRSNSEAQACRILLGHARFLQTLGLDPRTVTPGVPIIGRPRSLTVASLVERIVDRVSGEEFALTISRVDNECTASASWGVETDEHAPMVFGHGDDVVEALTSVVLGMQA